MCAPSQGAMLPYGLKVPSPYFPFGPNGGLSQVHLSALDFQRSQMNDYNVRVQFGLRNYQNSVGLSSFHAYFNDPYTQAYFYKHDPRTRFVQEEPKPSHSYIGLIGMAILNSKDKKLVLSDIYQWILDNYPYFRTRGPGWRNSIRHNLSLNDCFIKAGRSANGKGHYWAVHPANVEDFERGDFRRRRAQRKVRRHMGLSVPDDDDSPTPSPTQSWPHHDMIQGSDVNQSDSLAVTNDHTLRHISARSDSDHMVISHSNPAYGPVPVQPRKPSRKRLFDMASLLAPDDDEEVNNKIQETHNQRLHSQQLHVTGFMFHPIQEQKSSDQEKLHHMKTNISRNRSTENVQSNNSVHNITEDVNTASSDNGKDVSFASDDDQENDEIQVTSGDDSPAQDDDDSFYMREDYPAGDKHINDFFNAKTPIKNDHESSRNPSSPRNAESKSDNALDLSSPTQFIHDKKVNETTCVTEMGKSFECNFISQSLILKDDGVRLSQLACKTDDKQTMKETVCVKCNGKDESETLNDRCSVNTSNSNCTGCEQMRIIDSDMMLSKLPYRTRCEPRGEQLCSMLNGVVDHARSSTEKLHYFRAEPQDPRRPHNQSNGDSNFRSMDNGLAESDRRNDVATRCLTSESSVFVSDPARLSNDQIMWKDMSKNVLARDRLSAFSTLGIRNHGVYPPFQLRNFPLTSQRLLPTATSIRTSLPESMLSVSTTSSSNLIHRLDSDVNKNKHISSSIDIISNNTGSNNRD